MTAACDLVSNPAGLDRLVGDVGALRIGRQFGRPWERNDFAIRIRSNERIIRFAGTADIPRISVIIPVAVCDLARARRTWHPCIGVIVHHIRHIVDVCDVGVFDDVDVTPAVIPSAVIPVWPIVPAAIVPVVDLAPTPVDIVAEPTPNRESGSEAEDISEIIWPCAFDVDDLWVIDRNVNNFRVSRHNANDLPLCFLLNYHCLLRRIHQIPDRLGLAAQALD